MQKPKTNRICHGCLTRGGMEWRDGQHWRSRGVQKEREKKKAGSEVSVKINVIFAERKKNGRGQAPLLADLPRDIIPIDSFVLQEHM